jgi:hypothetical protein
MAGFRSVPPAEGRDVRRHLVRVALIYLGAVLVSSLVLRAGAAMGGSAADNNAMAAPWMIIGLGGAVGSVTIATAALYARGGLRSSVVDQARLDRALLLARLGRLLMLAVAVGAAVLSVLLAPTGMDRAFAIGINAGLAALLALFALLSVDVTRTVAAVRAP